MCSIKDGKKKGLSEVFEIIERNIVLLFLFFVLFIVIVAFGGLY